MKRKLNKGAGNTDRGLADSILQGWPSLDFVSCFLEVRKRHPGTGAGCPPPLSWELENRALKRTACPSEDHELPGCPGIEQPGVGASSCMQAGSAHRDGSQKSSKLLPG